MYKLLPDFRLIANVSMHNFYFLFFQLGCSSEDTRLTQKLFQKASEFGFYTFSRLFKVLGFCFSAVKFTSNCVRH